ncbi:MAG: Stp1/IreP family PP2C-type Ser/Thr phosphatase [Candidatus Omnitrophota bacterium]
MESKITFKVKGVTDVGLVREDNEDDYVIAEKLGLFIVADGIGGHNAGEIASKTATKAILNFFQKIPKKDLSEDIENKTNEAVQAAHQQILNLSLTNPSLEGLGTTFVSAFFKQPNYFFIANIGDSRAYLFKNKKLEVLSQDHSVVAQLVQRGDITQDQARNHPSRNIVTQALGIDISMGCHQKRIGVKDRDIIILCSDGLWDMLADKAIERVVEEKGSDPQSLCFALVNAAKAAGGNDNITVIVIFVSECKKDLPQEIFAQLQKEKVNET